MTKPELAVGPMSREVIEATFRYSQYHRKELMLISSMNQIDYNGGYVEGWTTKEYMNYIRELKDLYPQSKVKICRDHCGPGFNGNHDLKEVYNTIKSDIEGGFDLIHIDFCHFKGSKEEQFEETKKAIKYAKSLNNNIQIEVGTDENEGTNYGIMNIEELKREIEEFESICKPEFYVVQTGSLVMEINQVGNFNEEFVKKAKEILNERGIKLKEHNADYLDLKRIEMREGKVDAVNIAPQLGVVQTMEVIKECLIYGVNFSKFLEKTYESRKWEKWLKDNTKENKFLCLSIAGHYNFKTEEYKELIENLSKVTDIKEKIIEKAMEVIDHYA